MVSTDHLCMRCMREIGEAKICPHCGYHVDSVQIPPYLPVRTLVANRYLVGTLLDYNSEGATYIGWDLTEKKAVKIREFIPDTITVRDEATLQVRVMQGQERIFGELRQSFNELWTKLARLKGLSALISVNAVAEDHGTSYAIYDHFEGISLRDFLLRSKTGYLPWERAQQLLMPILSTLGTLHSAGIIHRGISPSTLVIAGDGKIKITGFCIGAARTARSELSSQLFDGYAAIEQYGFNGQQGTWTDIYAFGAVLYRTLIGSDPISARERIQNDRLMVPGKFAEALPAYVINGLVNALQILPEDRTRTVEQLRAELSASPVATAVSGQYQQQAAPPRAAGSSPAKRSRKSKKPVHGGAVVLLTMLLSILLGLGIFALLSFTVFKDKYSFSFIDNTAATTDAAQAEIVKTPDFVTRSYYDVISNPVFKNNFNFVQEFVYDDEVAVGYIVRQSVAPDTDVPQGTTITLYVSNGKEAIPLPDVTGKPIDEAEKMLLDLGFTVEKIEMTDPTAPDKVVLKMSPLAEKSYNRGTKVILQVNDLPQQTTSAEDEETTRSRRSSYDETEESDSRSSESEDSGNDYGYNSGDGSDENE